MSDVHVLTSLGDLYSAGQPFNSIVAGFVLYWAVVGLWKGGGRVVRWAMPKRDPLEVAIVKALRAPGATWDNDRQIVASGNVRVEIDRDHREPCCNRIYVDGERVEHLLQNRPRWRVNRAAENARAVHFARLGARIANAARP